MNTHDQKESAPEAVKSQGRFYSDNLSGEDVSGHDASSKNSASWTTDVEQTLQLGEQFAAFIGGVVDLARVEILLAIRTLPKLMMLWLLIMPIMLLTWCAFSALMAWSVFAASGQVGLGILVFFLQQVLLLLICRWLFVRYRTRMTLPYTRAQIDNFVRSTQDGFNSRSKEKK
jgi:uncharacterized membrane protein YqjE